jgi:hypothetical protein
MTDGLAAAPVFPLRILTTMQRMGGTKMAGTTRTVSLQVAASAIGGAALAAAMGLAIGALGATSVGPLLLVLAVAMCGLYGYMSSLTTGATTLDLAKGLRAVPLFGADGDGDPRLISRKG